MSGRTTGPGKSFRKGISLVELISMFPDDEVAEEWFIEQRWPNGIRCAFCEGKNVQESAHPEMRFWCTDCRRHYSAKTNTVMHRSRLGLQKWAIAIYQMTVNIKVVSSMKLCRDLGVTQKTAWHLAHRIREAWDDVQVQFAGPVEADETYVGGREGNKHANRRLRAGRGTVGKSPVAGVRDRSTNYVSAAPVPATDRETLQEFVHSRTQSDAMVYTDDARAYIGLSRPHETVSHSAGEYVNGQASTNGMESFWAVIKRGYNGVYHWFSVKHLARYVHEFSGRHNYRPLDTVDQMSILVFGMIGKRLTYSDLIGHPQTRINGQLQLL